MLQRSPQLVRFTAGIPVVLLAGSAFAIDLGPGLATDLNADGLVYGAVDTFGGGTYGLDDTAQFNGNDIAVWTGLGPSLGDGGGFSIPISNGGANVEPVDTGIAALGNASGRLENGNVVRFSAWVRSDPNNPVMSPPPQIEPVFKLEFWELALGTDADFTGGIDNPGSGDRIFDTDQNGTANTIPDVTQRAQWVDLDGDGATSFGNPVAGTAITSDWTLIEHTYTIDDSTWAIGGVTKTIADVQELRPVVFFGDFVGTDLTDAGSHWLDNALVEVFADSASVTDNTNPDPTLSEVSELLGDYDGSGFVSQSDLDLVLLNWGSATVPAEWVAADQFDGVQVSQNELDGVLLNWGNGTPPGVSAVPEPTSLVLLGLGGSAILLRRRRLA